MLVKKKRYGDTFEQMCFDNITLNTGDILYKNGVEYGKVTGESDALYFLQRTGSSSDMPSPYHKEALIENILFGVFTLKSLNYD